MKEIWKGVIYNGENYSWRLEVSNTGKLRNAETKHIYKLCLNKEGYLQVCISLGSRDNKKVFKPHKAVAEAFVENPFNKAEVNHEDGIKTNNNDWNLEWMTGKENVQHAVANSLMTNNHLKGTKSKFSKLSERDVIWALENYIYRDKKYNAYAIGIKLKVDHKTIDSIIRNKTWKHIDRSKINNIYIKK